MLASASRARVFGSAVPSDASALNDHDVPSVSYQVFGARTRTQSRKGYYGTSEGKNFFRHIFTVYSIEA